MTDTEQQEMKEENARLLREKAAADAEWHKEVRATLKAHSTELQSIVHNTSELPQLRAELRDVDKRVKRLEDLDMDKRVKRLEDLATKMVAGISVTLAFIAAMWKLIDKLWT